jgi:DNA oxidative demethylase
MLSLPEGVRHLPRYLGAEQQAVLVEEIRNVVSHAPLFVPKMPKTGKEMSVRMTNCGTLGWVTDMERGYRYQAMHPVTGKPWPDMPRSLKQLWKDQAYYSDEPEACLINFYSSDAKMGLHQDRDESEFSAPVLSVSLGDACLFRVGGVKRNGPTVSFRLESGDVMLLEGPGRLAFHGVDRIYPESSQLLKNGGRINLTLRRVTKPS